MSSSSATSGQFSLPMYLRKCKCNTPVKKAISRTTKNRGHEFFCCTYGACDYFRWVDSQPMLSDSPFLHENCPKKLNFWIGEYYKISESNAVFLKHNHDLRVQLSILESAKKGNERRIRVQRFVIAGILVLVFGLMLR